MGPGRTFDPVWTLMTMFTIVEVGTVACFQEYAPLVASHSSRFNTEWQVMHPTATKSCTSCKH
jgi:hypothetical protein